MSLAFGAQLSARQTWYEIYDDAVRDVQRQQWTSAEEKLLAAKKAGPRPGRRVLRYGMLRQPFIPDYYLAQVYVGLAEDEQDPVARRRWIEKALEAIALAEQTQVGKGDPEFKSLDQIQVIARQTLALAKAPVEPEPTPAEPAPRVDEARVAAVREIERLVGEGDKALAGADWDAAVTALQQTAGRLNDLPALRADFPQIPGKLREAVLGRDIAAALQLLRAGRFAAARTALERASGTPAPAPLFSAPLGTLIAGLPNRIREAQAGEALMSAEDAFRNRQWSAAIRGFESARTLVADIEFSSAQARDLAALVPGRLKDATLNAAIAERRFADALAIDPANVAALAGQYARAVEAYNAGRWADAAGEFAVLMEHAPNYRDVRDRSLAADLHVEYGRGLEAEQAGNTAVAREHFDRVGQLQRSISGPLLDSAAVVRAVEAANDRLRHIDARAVFESARRQYENGQWDEARNSVNLVLRSLPDDQEATALLQRLNDTVTGQQVQDLIRGARDALARRDLDAASAAASSLQVLLPQNEDAAFVLAEVSRIRDLEQQRLQWAAAIAGVMSIGPILLISTRRRGRFFAAIGRPVAALRLYERVLSANPNDGVTLSRAASLAIENGISAPLDAHFEAYLKARPDDTRLTTAAADYFWAEGRHAAAVDLYERLLTSAPNTVPTSAFQRLAEFYQGALPERVVTVLERASRERPSESVLTTLLATQYASSMRADTESLVVYRRACADDPENASLRLSYARALLACGDTRAAVQEAEQSARRQPGSTALDVLADALQRASDDDALDIAPRLAALHLPADALLIVSERLATARPRLRSALSRVYAALPTADTAPVVASALEAHGRLDEGDLDGARHALVGSPEPAALSDTQSRALLEAHLRYIAASTADGRPADYGMVARVAQLRTLRQEREQAIRTWQSIVSVPEWNRRSMAAIQTILDTLPLADVARAYFSTSDWRATDNVGEERPGITTFRVSPPADVSTELGTRFANTPVFCYSTVVTVDDLVQLKRDVLASREGTHDAVAFLLSLPAVRHDVYALIYAFMTEEPGVTVIPLEMQAVRDAVIEARSRVHLERTLHQWLGHTDIYETHNPVSNAATFFGRGHFINQLVLKISRGENFGIFGLRKIGKTSLVYRLRELSRDHLVAYIDLQGVASRRTDEVYLRLLESLARDMRVKYPEVEMPALQLRADAADAATPSVAERFHADVLGLRRALEAHVTTPPNILLLLDEIELMVPYGSSPGFDGHQDFFRHIRGLFQQERFVVSAVVGATPTVCRTARWGVRDNPVFQFYDEIFLAMLDRVECDQMVQGLGELMGVRFDQDSLALVYEQTAGHPYVTRQLCSRLVRLFPERPLQVDAAMVHASIEEYLAQRGDYFAGLVEGYLDDGARRVVETIAMAAEESETRTRLVQALGSLGGTHVADRVLGDLELVGVLRRDGERYRLRAPLFRRWLRRSWLGLE